MTRKRSLAKDYFNLKFDNFFRGEADINGWEIRLHEVDTRSNTILWVRWTEPNEGFDDGLAVTGGDVKHLSFPNLNVPFPFRKRY
jgi:hypothetical protein